MSAILNKRRFIALAAASTAAACAPTPERKQALHALTIRLAPNRTSALMAELERFADTNGFRWAHSTHPWGEQVTTLFDLVRRDLEIYAHNPPHDTPVDIPVGELPSMDKDLSRFSVAFFAGREAPTTSELQAAIRAFTASAETVDTVRIEAYAP